MALEGGRHAAVFLPNRWEVRRRTPGYTGRQWWRFRGCSVQPDGRAAHRHKTEEEASNAMKRIGTPSLAVPVVIRERRTRAMDVRNTHGDGRRVRPAAWAALVAAVLSLSALSGTAWAAERVALVIGAVDAYRIVVEDYPDCIYATLAQVQIARSADDVVNDHFSSRGVIVYFSQWPLSESQMTMVLDKGKEFALKNGGALSLWKAVVLEWESSRNWMEAGAACDGFKEDLTLKKLIKSCKIDSKAASMVRSRPLGAQVPRDPPEPAKRLGARDAVLRVLGADPSGDLHDQRDREPEQHSAPGGAHPRALPQRPRSDEAGVLGVARGAAQVASAAASLASGACGTGDPLR